MLEQLVLLGTTLCACALAAFVLRKRQAPMDEKPILPAPSRGPQQTENSQQSEFLARMSHELRTPLAAMMGYADLLRKDNLSPSQRMHAGMIAQAGENMMRLIDDILDSSRIEAGKLAIAPEPTNIARLLHQTTTALEPLALAKGIKLDSWVDEAVPEMAQLDALRVRQIITNLIGNAIKFTENGGIDVEARVENASDGAHLLFSVIDTGIGIAPDKLKSILEPYQQADAAIARLHGGTGLGLAISNELAQLMGGRLIVHSKPGMGSCFALRVALHNCDETIARSLKIPPQPSSDIPASAMLRGSRLLVVEDDVLSQHLIRALSARMGMEVVVTKDGEHAIRLIKAELANGRHFDAALVDMNLPGIDGLEICRRLRAQGITPDMLPIFALTANISAQAIAQCCAAGMQAHIAKPVTSVALARELARTLVTRGPTWPASDPEIHQPERQAEELHRQFLERKERLLASLRKSLEGEPDSTDWPELATQLHRLAGVAGTFGEPALGDVSRKLQEGLDQAPEPRECQELLRRIWPRLEEIA